MDAFLVALNSVWVDSGFISFTMGHGIMILVGIILLYLAFAKGFEPLLLSPIAFGCILANIPNNGFHEGVMNLIGLGIKYEIFPPLIFLGVGAMTDFGPLIANPKTLLLGAAAQIGVFVALGGAMMVGFTAKQVMKLFTTQKDREIVMEQLREVTRFEKVVFPVVATISISLLLPPITSLLGMLMLGNLFRESGVTARLADTSENALINTVTIFLATGTGLTMTADSFLNLETIKIIVLGLVAFIGGTAGGVIFGKLMCWADGGKTNPLIGSAGVSAVPMAARVSQVVGSQANPSNFLLMHAMGPNVAGVIGTAVAAGTMLAMMK